MLHLGLQGVRDKVLGVGEGGFGSLCCKKKDIIRPGPGERSTEDECNTLGWNQLKFNPELGGSRSIMAETVTIRGGVYHLKCHTDPFPRSGQWLRGSSSTAS
jgi:hypothetical protein